MKDTDAITIIMRDAETLANNAFKDRTSLVQGQLMLWGPFRYVGDDFNFQIDPGQIEMLQQQGLHDIMDELPAIARRAVREAITRHKEAFGSLLAGHAIKTGTLHRVFV